MFSREQAREFGLAQRNQLRRRDLQNISKRRFDPLDVLRAAGKDHVPRLLPIKFERMSESPFAFFRGAVEVMAAELGAYGHTGIEVQLCGDAHLKNFGFYATLGSDIILDINDFDVTTRGPWEWDVKRCATSIVLAGRVAGDGSAACKQAASMFLRDYSAWMQRFADMPSLEVARHRALRDYRDPFIRSALKQAERSTPLFNLKKLTRGSSRQGFRFIRERNLLWEVAGAERKNVLAALPAYRKTLAPDRQMIFDRYTPADVGFKVVGTGSVGTRDYVVLLFGRDARDPLFLQIKEEPPCAYAPYYKDRSAPRNQGQRVVQGQRAMQVFSDLLLGWCSIAGRDYLVRQLSDHKSSIEPEELGGQRLAEYSCVCAELLAKGHARSGEPVALASYLGRSGKAERALLQFAVKYADQTESDYEAFKKGLRRGFAKGAASAKGKAARTGEAKTIPQTAKQSKHEATRAAKLENVSADDVGETDATA
jgi:uncharacterized protein (DUF2252 family)